MQGKKKKMPVVKKPYYKGNAWVNKNIKEALKVLAYFLFFSVLYVIAGSALNFDAFLLRLVPNLLLVVICGGIMYTKGASLGENDAALGEIVHARLESGKEVDEKDKKLSFHPLRGWLIFLVAVLPILLITVPSALGAHKQVYEMQSLPSWVSAYQSNEEIYAPLAFHDVKHPMQLMDLLQYISRLLIFPFVNIFGTDNLDTLLVLDKLAPILAILVGVAFPVGYMGGPFYRARVHGDIARNNRKAKKKQQKQLQRKQQQQKEIKKNELI